MPNIFDEANKATEEMFTEQTNPEAVENQNPEENPENTSGSEETQTAEVSTEEAPASASPENANPEQTALGEAAQTAEVAAQVAAMVGKVNTGSPSLQPAPFAVSSALPPPMPKIMSTLASFASAAIRSICS